MKLNPPFFFCVSEVEAAGTNVVAPLPPVLKGTESEAEVNSMQVKKIIVTEDEDHEDEVVEEVRTRTYQRTKSQEFCEYQQEFVLASVNTSDGHLVIER